MKNNRFMLWRRFRFPILFLLVFVAVVFGWYLFALSRNLVMTKVVFLDVGQGDAILLSQGTHQVLIDGGRVGKTLLTRLGKHIPFWDRSIDVVIATHPDADHIGGLPDLFRVYRINAFLSNGVDSDTETSRILRSAVEVEGTQLLSSDRGMTFLFPRGGRLEVVYPSSGETFSTTNEGSIVTRFSFGETDFLLTGDLPNEEFFLPDTPETEVLKVAHHGSKYSTSDAFLNLIKPKEAVISVGENRYGHPASEVLNRLSMHDILIRRTDVSGDIVYQCLPGEDSCVIR